MVEIPLLAVLRMEPWNVLARLSRPTGDDVSGIVSVL
jgi:hypothetical protein